VRFLQIVARPTLRKGPSNRTGGPTKPGACVTTASVSRYTQMISSLYPWVYRTIFIGLRAVCPAPGARLRRSAGLSPVGRYCRIIGSISRPSSARSSPWQRSGNGIAGFRALFSSIGPKRPPPVAGYPSRSGPPVVGTSGFPTAGARRGHMPKPYPDTAKNPRHGKVARVSGGV
jgi:hypothetical protein